MRAQKLKEAGSQETKKQLKDAQLAELEAIQNLHKLDALSSQVSQAIQTVLNQAEVTLPVGKQIIITVGEMGPSTSVVNQKPDKGSQSGNGGAKGITYRVEKLTADELTLIKQALEMALENWVAQERGLQVAKVLFPDHYHMLYTEDELPSEALDLAEMLLIKISEELRRREEAGETIWWKEEETLTRGKSWRLVRRRN